MIKYIETIRQTKKPANCIQIDELLHQNSTIIEYCEQKTQNNDFDLQDFEAAEACSYTLERTLEGLVGQICGLNNEIIDKEVIEEGRSKKKRMNEVENFGTHHQHMTKYL